MAEQNGSNEEPGQLIRTNLQLTHDLRRLEQLIMRQKHVIDTLRQIHCLSTNTNTMNTRNVFSLDPTSDDLPVSGLLGNILIVPKVLVADKNYKLPAPNDLIAALNKTGTNSSGITPGGSNVGNGLTACSSPASPSVGLSHHSYPRGYDVDIRNDSKFQVHIISDKKTVSVDELNTIPAETPSRWYLRIEGADTYRMIRLG